MSGLNACCCANPQCRITGCMAQRDLPMFAYVPSRTDDKTFFPPLAPTVVNPPLVSFPPGYLPGVLDPQVPEADSGKSGDVGSMTLDEVLDALRVELEMDAESAEKDLSRLKSLYDDYIDPECSWTDELLGVALLVEDEDTGFSERVEAFRLEALDRIDLVTTKHFPWL